MNINNVSIPEISLEAQILITKFKSMAIGETATYAELTALVGRDVRNQSAAITAKKRVERECGIIIAAIRGIGLKRLDDVGIIAAGSCRVGRMRRIAKRAMQVTMRVRDVDALTADQRAELARVQTTASVVQLFTKKDGQAKITEAAKSSGASLPPLKCLDLFRSGK